MERGIWGGGEVREELFFFYKILRTGQIPRAASPPTFQSLYKGPNIAIA